MIWTEPLLEWYGKNARDLPWRRTRDPYRIWVSEIMLQQTRVEAVRGYYERFLAELPNVPALAAVEDDRLMKLWEGLGYYSRARSLKKAAIVLMAHDGGRLPADGDALRGLPGIGPYTAGAIGSIAFGLPIPAVDGNVLRVLARLNADGADIAEETTKRRVRDALTREMPQDRPGMFNQAMMELGACVCVPNGAPHCSDCPIRSFCRANAEGRTADFPVKRGKAPRRIEQKTVFALRRADGAYAGRKRPDTGLLAGLWQLPDTEGFLRAEEMTAFLTKIGASPVGELRVYERKHIFTHIEWRMRVCAAEVTLPALPDGWLWLEESVHALPTAYRVCLT